MAGVGAGNVGDCVGGDVVGENVASSSLDHRLTQKTYFGSLTFRY